MFLDDKLLQHVMEYDMGGNDAHVMNLLQDLHHMAQDYLLANLLVGMKKTEAVEVVDRTQNLWLSFVRMAKKQSGGNAYMFAPVFEKYDFKWWLLNDTVRKQAYLDWGGKP